MFWYMGTIWPRDKWTIHHPIDQAHWHKILPSLYLSTSLEHQNSGHYDPFLRLRCICTKDYDFNVESRGLFPASSCLTSREAYPKHVLEEHCHRASMFNHNDLSDNPNQRENRQASTCHNLQPGEFWYCGIHKQTINIKRLFSISQKCKVSGNRSSMFGSLVMCTVYTNKFIFG